MSGAEALAVIGIIANSIALAEFTGKILQRVKEYGEKANELPQSFQDVSVILPLVGKTLERCREKADSGSLDDASWAALRPIFERCESKMAELENIFTAVLARAGASRVERGWKTLQSLRRDEAVKRIARALRDFVSILAHHQVFATATTLDIESISQKLGVVDLKQTSPAPPRTYFNVPVRWSDDFTGREDVLESLDSKVCIEDQYSRAALVGLGGMGYVKLMRSLTLSRKDHIDLLLLSGKPESCGNMLRDSGPPSKYLSFGFSLAPQSDSRTRFAT